MIGPGAVAELHADAIRAAGGTLAAVAGHTLPSTQDFAARHGIRAVHTDVNQMLRTESLDAVVVASPSDLHVKHTLTALEHGLDVLCEVPLATSLADGREVVAAAERHGRQVMVAHTLRFMRPHREVRRLVSTGQLTITQLVARRLQLRQRDVGWTGRPRDWVDDVLWHHAAHLVDLAAWLLDDSPEAVYGGVGQPWDGNGRPMDVAAVLRTRDSRLASLALSYHSRESVNDVLLISPEQTLVIADGRLRRGAELLVDSGDLAAAERAAVAAQDAHFLEVVGQGREPEPSAEDVLAVLEVLDKLAPQPSVVKT
nr:Gfo/Idh/MocA family oxidoreductase [Actinopolymorpha cephalotaxi]